MFRRPMFTTLRDQVPTPTDVQGQYLADISPIFQQVTWLLL